MVRTEKEHASSPTLESLIANRRVEAWVLCLSENETDPNEIFLKLDWRFRGAVAKAIASGAISRESGEVSLLPFTRPSSNPDFATFQVLTVGVKDRRNVTASELGQLARNIDGLSLKKIGLSATDFGWSAADAKRHFPKNGAELCVIE